MLNNTESIIEKNKIDAFHALELFDKDERYSNNESRINAKKYREVFVKQYPIENIEKLSLEEYAGDNSFSKKIRIDLQGLASMGNAYPDTFGIYIKKETKEVVLSKTYNNISGGDIDMAFIIIKQEIVKLLKEFEQIGFDATKGVHLNRMYVYKLLLIYYPEKVFPVCARGTLQKYCECVGLSLDPRDEMYVGIQKLLSWKKNVPSFKEWDNAKLMHFCDWLLDNNKTIDGKELENTMIELSKDKNVSEWVISGNPNRFDVISAFRDLKKINWRQSTNISVGDIVYIYVSSPVQSIRFKCKVNKTELIKQEIDDRKYDLNGEFDDSYGRFMELELMCSFDTELFNRENLEKYGFSIPQSPRRVPAKLKEYMDVVQLHLHSDESDEDDGFLPTLEQYCPEISAKEYRELLTNNSVVRKKWLDVLFSIYKLGGKATCSQIANQYGNTAQHYNANATNIARAIQRYTECPVYEDTQYGGYWSILFYGKLADSEEGSFVWKLREPLYEAIKELDEEGWFDMENKNDNIINYPVNTILYGPPGTGKTYSTVLYAVGICENKLIDELKQERYENIFKRYNQYIDEGRIVFTTFHQSYGYEEFIEGIKPVVDESKNISYEIEDGIFKEFCEEACNSGNDGVNFNASIYVVRLNGKGDNDLKDACFREGEIRFDWDKDNPEDWIKWLREMKAGDYVLSYARESRFIDGIGIVKDEEPVYDESKDSFNWKRSVEWLIYGKEIDVMTINGGKYLSNYHVGRVPNMKVSSLLSLMDKDFDKKKDYDQPYVFIIDEINRGNISKIFGELITLIEDTKRLGREEETEAILPYSHMTFGIPKNVYILGTMNTADRSIALMDTALRRRFSFVEMMPDSNVLRNLGINVIEEDGVSLDVADMLDVINERIEYLYDREHTIGHAFFTALKGDKSISKLSGIFKNKVIPLLQEYFYEDYGKIQLVLGDNDKSNDKYKFILDTKVQSKQVFKGNTANLDLPEKKYLIQNDAFDMIQSYKEIADNL